MASAVRQTLRHLNNRRSTRRILRAAGPLASFAAILGSGLFDSDWYAMQVRRRMPMGRVVGCAHYVFIGRRRGLSPHPLFEPEYIDPVGWRSSAIDPFAMYLANRRRWRNAPHPLFDGGTYLEATPGAAKHRWGPLGHFVATAQPETPLPIATVAEGQVAPTWAAGRQRLERWLEGWAEQERRRRVVRVTPSYDRSRERRFLRRWLSAPVPPVPPMPDGSPLVSVVLPVWNRADEVREAIASVQAQTLHDWELLVVDDGSTDGSADAVAAIAAGDPRVRLLRQPHSGVSRARNLALAQARGRYIAFLDSDNTYFRHFLRTAVAAMHGQKWDAAYAAMQLDRGQNVQYRALDAGGELLGLRNHIDLNVLVVAREILDQVGRFDEKLRRAVDYDLILRIGQVGDIHYLPFIGAHYDHDDSAPDRITNREPISWLEVVQNNNLIDWEAQLSGRVPGRVSVLIQTHEDWLFTCRCIDSLRTEAGDTDLEIVLIDNASRRAVGTVLAAFCAIDRRIRLVREPIDRNPALASNLAFTHSTGQTVVFLDHDTEVQPGWLEPLLRALDRPAVLAAQPLLLHSDGTIKSAGIVFPGRVTFQVQFLAQHPVEDAVRLGESFEIPAVTGAALAMRAEDVIAVKGFDPIFRNAWKDADLSLRLGQLRPGTFAVATGSVALHYESETVRRSRHPIRNREIFRDRWSGRLPPAADQLWQAAGFTVAHYAVDPAAGVDPAVAVDRPDRTGPILTRPLEEVTAGTAKGLPAFRWAIKLGSPAGKRGLTWGDLHFARALSAALERLGQSVVLDSREAHDRESGYLDDVVLVLRGLSRVEPQPGRVNLLWVISHPDLVDAAEMDTYDGLFAASMPWAAGMSEQLGRPVEPLLQCTDPDRFQPGVAAPDTGEDVLFVGNSRNVCRPIVRDAVAAGVDLAVYGNHWERFLDRRFLRGSFIPNDELAAAYRSAGVLLNDHWDDMRREGFISNRVFDATAAGARVLSDEVPGLEDTFGGLVRTYRTADELADLLTRPRDEVFPGEADRLHLADRVRREHSFDARARRLVDAAAQLQKDS